MGAMTFSGKIPISLLFTKTHGLVSVISYPTVDERFTNEIFPWWIHIAQSTKSCESREFRALRSSSVS